MKFLSEWTGRQWERLKPQMMLPLVVLGIFWVIYALDFALPVRWQFKNLGIRPWSHERPMIIGGLTGIPFAPFLHAHLGHILANTVSWAILGWVTVLSGRGLFLRVCIVTAITSGLGCWLFGDSSRMHIGASGVIFGMLGFLLARGWCARRLGWTIIALLVGFQYLGTVLSLFATDALKDTSWSMHFWGFAGGIGLAWWMYGREPDSGKAGPAPLPDEKKPASKTAPQPHR